MDLKTRKFSVEDDVNKRIITMDFESVKACMKDSLGLSIDLSDEFVTDNIIDLLERGEMVLA